MSTRGCFIKNIFVICKWNLTVFSISVCVLIRSVKIFRVIKDLLTMNERYPSLFWKKCMASFCYFVKWNISNKYISQYSWYFLETLKLLQLSLMLQLCLLKVSYLWLKCICLQLPFYYCTQCKIQIYTVWLVYNIHNYYWNVPTLPFNYTIDI